MAGGSDEADMIEYLAAVLYGEMRMLDAVGDPPWGALSDYDKEYFRTCAEAVYAAHQRGRPTTTR